jgi:hypothetical protein
MKKSVEALILLYLLHVENNKTLERVVSAVQYTLFSACAVLVKKKI